MYIYIYTIIYKYVYIYINLFGYLTILRYVKIKYFNPYHHGDLTVLKTTHVDSGFALKLNICEIILTALRMEILSSNILNQWMVDRHCLGLGFSWWDALIIPNSTLYTPCSVGEGSHFQKHRANLKRQWHSKIVDPHSLASVASPARGTSIQPIRAIGSWSQSTCLLRIEEIWWLSP